MTFKCKPFRARSPQPPFLGSAQVPDSPSLSWRICVKEPNLLLSVNSPHQSEREEQRAPAQAGGTGGGAARPPRGQRRQRRPQKRNRGRPGGGHTPLSHPRLRRHRTPLGLILSRRTDSCSRWGRGREPHPGELGHRRLFGSASPAPKGATGSGASTGTLTFKPTRQASKTPAHRLPHPLPSPSPPGLGAPHSPRGEKKTKNKKPLSPIPHPTEEPRKFGPGPKPAPPRSRLPIGPRRGLASSTWRAPPGRPRLAAGSPGPALPPRRRPGGGGRGGLGAAAATRGAEAAPRSGRERQGEGRGGEGGEGRGRPHLRHCNARSRRAFISGGSGEPGGDKEGGSGGAGERVAPRGASVTAGSRRPGGSLGISRVGAPSTPGDEDREPALPGPRRRSGSK